MSLRIVVVAGVLALTRVALAQPEPPAEPGAGSGSGSAEEPAPAPDADATPAAGDDGANAPADASPPAGAPAPNPVPEPATTPAPATPPADGPARPRLLEPGFHFGSYGRIGVGTDLRGGSPEQVKVVAHAPRVVEPSYLEVELSDGFLTPRGAAIRTVTTIAFDDTLFHYTGKFDAQPALRNFYAEALFDSGLELWVGSRMYRGDDIYLFDYWPLDDVNTVGGGARYTRGRLSLAAHAGANRLLDDFQYQTKEVPDPNQGATTVTQLNRQRMIGSVTAVVRGPDFHDRIHTKLKLYGEVQGLPSGTRLRADATPEHLPSDLGTTIGVQLGAWGFADPGDTKHQRHLNLFARWSKGLTAYDELAPPTEVDNTLKTYPKASELVFGLSGAWDTDRGNLVVGALSRRFLGAGPQTDNPDSGWEYALDARPLVRAAGDVYAGVDLSFQARFPRGINPGAQLIEDAGVAQVAPMIVYSPMGPGAYARPELRLVYRAAHLDQGALDLYAPDDPRHAHPWVHYLGVQAEWWFNSSSYP